VVQSLTRDGSVEKALDREKHIGGSPVPRDHRTRRRPRSSSVHDGRSVGSNTRSDPAVVRLWLQQHDLPHCRIPMRVQRLGVRRVKSLRVSGSECLCFTASSIPYQVVTPWRLTNVYVNSNHIRALRPLGGSPDTLSAAA
jgi:hypothetical protein